VAQEAPVGGGDTGSGGAGETGVGAPAQVTAAPSVLPATGFVSGDSGSPSSVRLGDLGQQVTQSLLPSAGGSAVAAGPAWQFAPAIGATEELTDNAETSPLTGKPRGDLITTLQPSLAVTGDTPRFQVNLAYDPQIYLYARAGTQNRIDHEGNARVLATLLPQTLFLDLRASASEQAVSGGLGPLASNTLSSSNTEQDFSFSASPYLVHRFGSLGSGEVGYSLSRTVENTSTTFSNPQASLATPFGAFGPFSNQVQPSTGNQSITTQSAHVAFVTGEDFGRYNGTALVSASTSDGGGVQSGERRDIASLDNGYAVTRTITLLATLGWENIRYGGTAPVRIDDAIWSFGTRLEPNADSTLTVTYGHHDGLDSLTVDGALSPTPRTRLYVRYSKGLTTNAEDLQNALANSDLDSLGNPVDHGTGAPIYGGSNFFGVQNNLERLRRLSISGAYVLDRDTFTITVENEDTVVVSQASPVQQAGSIGSNSGTFGSIAWQHDLSPRLTGTLFLQYGVRTAVGPPAATQDAFDATASLDYALGPTVSTSVEVSHAQSTGGGTSDRQNIVLVSVVKTF
jgi:uncharacterized protein (PEP-CTERM system associated)